jgi:hypothetical protein
MAAKRGVDQGKSAFIKEVLQKDSKANAKVVNEAWKAAGHDGSISTTLVQKLRATLGLAGNLRAGRKPESRPAAANGAAAPNAVAPKGSGKKRGRPPGTTKAVRPHTNGASSAVAALSPRSEPTGAAGLSALEGELDRMIFSLMKLGDMSDIENALRKVRRLVILKGEK